MDSESKLQGSLPNDSPIPVCVVPYLGQGGEISLIDLWRVIVARKILILLSVLAAVLLASVYVFLTEPLYRAEADLLPPQQQDIQALVVNYRDNSEPYTPKRVYRAFLRNIKSKGVRREYFDTHDIVAHYLDTNSRTDTDIDRNFDEVFNSSFRVQANKQDASFIIISFADRDPVLAAQWLNQFIEFANEYTVRQLLKDVNTAIQADIEQVQYQLESKLKLASQRRQDRILNLREALRVAKALGIKSERTFPVITKKENPAIEVNTAQSPLYTRGIEALEAEIAVLESRKSDEPFITGLRDLQEKMAFLEGISIESNKVSAVTIDAAGRIPYQVEKPRKKLVFILALVLGLVIGILLAFVTDFRSRFHE